MIDCHLIAHGMRRIGEVVGKGEANSFKGDGAQILNEIWKAATPAVCAISIAAQGEDRLNEVSNKICGQYGYITSSVTRNAATLAQYGRPQSCQKRYVQRQAYRGRGAGVLDHHWWYVKYGSRVKGARARRAAQCTEHSFKFYTPIPAIEVRATWKFEAAS